MRKLSTIQPTLLEPWLDLEHAKELQAISGILEKHPEINELIRHVLAAARNRTNLAVGVDQGVRCDRGR